jgi:hypothetical protein
MNQLISPQLVAAHLLATYPTDPNQEQLSQLLSKNILFITMKFDGLTLLGSRSDPSTYLNIFASWYQSIIIKSFGRHYSRPSKLALQPLTYAFVDFPGSRYHRQHSRNKRLLAKVNVHDRTRHRGSSVILKSGPLHVHALMAVKPEQGQACRLPFLTSKFLNSRIAGRPQFGDIDIQAFDPNKGSLENLAEYAMKGATQMGPSSRSDWWDILPRINRTKPKPLSTMAHRQAEGSALMR